jgi:hypothetical protein
MNDISIDSSIANLPLVSAEREPYPERDFCAVIDVQKHQVTIPHTIYEVLERILSKYSIERTAKALWNFTKDNPGEVARALKWKPEEAQRAAEIFKIKMQLNSCRLLEAQESAMVQTAQQPPGP